MNGKQVLLHKINMLLAAIVGGLIVLFALQNLADAEVTFLFWNFQTKRYVVVMIAAAAGLLAGLALGYSIGHHHRSISTSSHSDQDQNDI